MSSTATCAPNTLRRPRTPSTGSSGLAWDVSDMGAVQQVAAQLGRALAADAAAVELGQCLLAARADGVACGQRGAKRQPDGASKADSGRPGIATSRSAVLVMSGRACTSAAL